MNESIRRISSDIERWRSQAGNREPLAMWALSQRLRGSWTPRDVRTIVAPNLDHRTIAVRADAVLECFPTPDGGSAISEELVGPIYFELDLRFAGELTSRGLHSGIAEWGRGETLVATLCGTNNAVAGSPTAVSSQLEGNIVSGLMNGFFEHNVLRTCAIVASYLLRVDDLAEETADVIGSIEGVVYSDDSQASA